MASKPIPVNFGGQTEKIKHSGRILGGIVLVVLLLLVMFNAWYTVDQGERGIQLRYGRIVGIAAPGLHFKVPFVDDVKFVSVQNQSRVYERVEAYSRDQQPATLRVSINFKIPEGEVDALYSQYGSIENIGTRLIDRKVYDEVKNIFGRYNAITVIQERMKFGADALAAVRDAAQGPVFIEGLQIEEIGFSDAYEQSIEMRMKAEVEIQTKRQNLESERINAEIAVTQAKARAEASLAEAGARAEAAKLQGLAEAEAIQARGDALRQNAGLVDLIVAEKWDGTLPTTMVPGGALPFLNLRATP
jgi:regulator of protease activity HflC (stomatin/prohibitin superfamily)